MKIQKEIEEKIFEWLFNGVTYWEIKDRLESVGIKITEEEIKNLEVEFMKK